MAISLVAVGAKITAALVNLLIVGVNAQGTTSIIPTSVAGTGVSVGAAGKVTFTAATSISINGCFTSTYDQYLVIIDVSAVSTSLQLGARLRLAGTDASGASDYGTQVLFSSGATTTSFAPAATSTVQVTPASAGRIQAKVDVFGPALARKTAFLPSGISPASATSVGLYFGAGTHELSTAYDGITFIPNTGNATGTVRVYGYNNN